MVGVWGGGGTTSPSCSARRMTRSGIPGRIEKAVELSSRWRPGPRASRHGPQRESSVGPLSWFLSAGVRKGTGTWAGRPAATGWALPECKSRTVARHRRYQPSPGNQRTADFNRRRAVVFVRRPRPETLDSRLGGPQSRLPWHLSHVVCRSPNSPIILKGSARYHQPLSRRDQGGIDAVSGRWRALRPSARSLRATLQQLATRDCLFFRVDGFAQDRGAGGILEPGWSDLGPVGRQLFDVDPPDQTRRRAHLL